MVEVALVACSCVVPRADDGHEVFISIDMEGVTPVAHWGDASRDGKDYDLFQ
ncbi:MAG: hypothetical protein P8127_06405 [Acidobacteriota bacterium]